MNTRDVSGQTFASQPLVKQPPTLESKEPEEIIFDKAEQAATLEDQKAYLIEVEKQLEVLGENLSEASEEQKIKINEAMTKLRQQQMQQKNKISNYEKTLEKDAN